MKRLACQTVTTETITDEDTVTTTEVLYYCYDASGSPLSVTLTDENGTESTYYYAVNIQGDVSAILTTDGSAVVEYTYDAWGNPLTATGTLADTLGESNSLRYRGYVYDQETGYYYLQSRYYNPELGRFINADAYASTGQGLLGNNMFAYCGNNPVAREDAGGNFWLASIAVGLVTQYVGDIIGNLIDGKTGVDIFKPTSSLGEYVAAGVTALIPGTGFGGALVRNVVSEGISIFEDAITGNEIDIVNSIVNVGLGTVLDVGFEKVSDKVGDFINSKQPKNYSSYAHEVRKKSSDLTREQIYRSMRRSIRANRAAAKVASFAIDVMRSLLPY